MNQAMLDQLKRKLADQTAELVSKAGVPPLVLGTLMLDIAIALALNFGVSESDVAESLRLHALKLEELDGHWHGPAGHA